MEIAVDFTELRENDPIESSLIGVFFFSVFPISAVPFPVDLRHIPAHAEIPADDKDFLPVQIEIRPIRVENQIWSSNVISVELHNVALLNAICISIIPILSSSVLYFTQKPPFFPALQKKRSSCSSL